MTVTADPPPVPRAKAPGLGTRIARLIAREKLEPEPRTDTTLIDVPSVNSDQVWPSSIVTKMVWSLMA